MQYEFINIYLPFANKQKELNFEEEIETLIDKKDNVMEVKSLRDLYVLHKLDGLQEEERKEMRKLKKQLKEEEALRKEEEALRKEQEALLKETEGRRKMQEALLKETEALLKEEEARGKEERKNTIINLYQKGFSLQTIADVLTQPLLSVKEIIDKYLQNLPTNH